MSDRLSSQDRMNAAVIFSALGDATRLHLAKRLGEGVPLSIVRLREGIPLSRQAVTKHLRTLERAGIVSSKRCGREHTWQLEPASLETARQSLDAIAARWEEALDRLKHFLEEGPGADDA